ncbi:MAG: altronate hydrolase [Cyclobacteriaceae bacterium]|jgi:altronate hydrolase
MNKLLKLHPKDNVIVALQDLKKNEVVHFEGTDIIIQEDTSSKHKFIENDMSEGEHIYMYGVIVGKTLKGMPKGTPITLANVVHDTGGFSAENKEAEGSWVAPNIDRFKGKTFNGYHRENGTVGTQNLWLVVPLVFCENRNILKLKEVLESALEYKNDVDYGVDVDLLINKYKGGSSTEELLNTDVLVSRDQKIKQRVFPNVDGIKFLTHDAGCGCNRQDAHALCELLAGYVTHPNVAGATVLSLGCQNAEDKIMLEAIKRKSPGFNRPLHVLEQQESLSEKEFIADAVRKIFVGLIEANKSERKPAPLSKLTVGLECGGSDGFSGISANPATGYMSDLLVGLGGSTILSEFPELNGVEQELINRCETDENSEKFSNLMTKYNESAIAVGSGFHANPSPGNIKDGLITDAIKSAGAAKKGGTSPIVDVLDYTEEVKKPGLNMLCTPGNDVESTTGLAGSWANVIVFTTGLGTPTGNPVTPVIKVSSNTKLFNKMNDIIDFDAGPVITGLQTIEESGEDLLDMVIGVANGEVMTKADALGQDDFIFWKRGVSL